MKMSNAKRVSVYEFADHVRQGIQQTYLMNTLEPRLELTLYIRGDCKSFMFSSIPTAVRYRNKYLMAAQFFFETAVLGRKVLLTTGPEAASGLMKTIFSGLLRVLRNRISVFIIVRDLKQDKGKFLLSPSLYSARSVLAVESEALLQSCIESGYAPGGYIYPTPITYRVMPYLETKSPKSRHGKAMKIHITGSLDTTRRNYEMLLESLAILKRNGVPLQVVLGGHCLSETAVEVLKRLEVHCDSLIARDLWTDAELDSALISADAIVCLNRPDFYGGIKGSGAIGDSFFAGKRLLIHADLVKLNSTDSRFYTCFTSAENLSDHLIKAYSNGEYLRIEESVLDDQTRYFSKLVSNWLML